MKIILHSIKIRKFKKLDDVQYYFGSGLNMLTGRNGSGKSSVLDAITWCLFGKDFTDRKKFNLMPLNPDQTEQIAIPGVTIEMSVDDEKYELTREVEDGSTACYINGASRLVKDFQDFVGRIFGNEDRFKMFAMPLYFPESLEWKAQRELFMQFFPNPEPGIVYARMIADKIVFQQDLITGLKKMAPADYIKIHEQALKAIEAEKIKINAQIELLDKQLEGQHDLNIFALAEEREQLREQMSQYTNRLAEVNTYNGQIAKTENHLQQQRNELLNQRTRMSMDLENAVNRERSRLEQLLENEKRKLASVRQQFIERQQMVISEYCPVCEQHMPEHMIEKTKQDNQALLLTIAESGNAAKKRIAELQDELNTLVKGDLPPELDEKIAEIDVKLAKIPAKQNPPELDEKIYTRLQEVERALARSDVHEENIKLREQAEAKDTQLNSEAEHHTIAIKDAGYFIQYQSKIVVEMINKEFKTISVKIFDTQKNGVTKETFEITSNGVPYSGLNTAGKLQAGIELTNFLKTHLKLQVPIIIDNGERYTDMDWTSIPGQAIIAMAKRGSQLKLEVN